MSSEKFAGGLHVRKRDGTLEPARFDRITDRNEILCGPAYGKELAYVAERLPFMTQEVARSFTGGMSTAEIDSLAAKALVGRATEHTDFSALAARIVASNLQKSTPKTLADVVAALDASECPRISDEYRGIVARGGAALDAVIDFRRDFAFTYFGIQTMVRSYVLRRGDMHAPPAERPQHVYARTALALGCCRPDRRGHEVPDAEFRRGLAAATEIYRALSEFRVSLASPMYFNGGTTLQQLASCYLLRDDDDLRRILQTEFDAQMISQAGGGIGLCVTPMRAEGSLIRSTGGKAQGVRPFLMKLQQAQKYVNQGGRRPGAFAVYLEVWHADVLGFLSAGRFKAGGLETAPRLKYALWVPDAFMRATEAELAERAAAARAGRKPDPAVGLWHLFCPDAAPGLYECHGKEFDELYARYVEEERYRRTILPSEIWGEWFETVAQRGQPYVLFKDAINEKSNLSHVRTISNSNLCVAGDTYVLTDGLHRPIADLVGKEVRVWNGAEWSVVTPRQTSRAARLVRVTLADGRSLDCTPEHKFYLAGGVEAPAAALRPGDELETAAAAPSREPYMVVCLCKAILGSKCLGCRYVDGLRDEARVASVESLPGLHATYCFTEPWRHRGVFNGILTGQCAEITIPCVHTATEKEYGVCNLASIPLATFVVPDPGAECGVRIDWAGIVEAAGTATRALDASIDINHYPLGNDENDPCKRSNLRHRPIAIGVMGFADVLAHFGLAYGSKEALALDAATHAAIYFGAMKASSALGRERGNFGSFEGSASQRGYLQPDLWVRRGDLRDNWAAKIEKTTGGAITVAMWDALRAETRVHLRNAYVTADMPTATTSQTVGMNESNEPFTTNLYTRRTLAGEFILVNPHLLRDLESRGLWDEEMRRALILSGGSVQGIDAVPDELKRVYRTTREIDQRHITRHAAAAGPFISQTKSLNYMFTRLDLPDALSVLFLGWKLGNTTGSYYIHTAPAAGTLNEGMITAPTPTRAETPAAGSPLAPPEAEPANDGLVGALGGLDVAAPACGIGGGCSL